MNNWLAVPSSVGSKASLTYVHNIRLFVAIKYSVVKGYLDELLLDRSQKVESRLDLRLWVVSFHSCRDHGNEPSLGGHLVGVGHHGDVDVALPANLLLGNDDLC